MKKFWKGIWKTAWIGAIVFLGTSILSVMIYRFMNPPVTPLMVIRMIEQSSDNQPLKLRKNWVSLDKISPSMPLAVIASEDNLFKEHHGFDMDAIEKAREYNLKKEGKKLRGASTISQQTAKNVFLWPQRSWVRKGLEVYFTVMIELIWGKQRIMEVYLNVIETGKGIYGVEAASRAYFKKSASSLTRGEAALIAAILPNPLKWNPVMPTAYLSGRQQWILWNMGNMGPVNF
jgi:monofunctional biosynthetic peptidoglycan transglycosylase